VRLVWTPRARGDLDEIVAHIAEGNPNAAERLAEYLYSAVALLCDQPGLGRPGRKEGTRELIVRRATWGSAYIVPYRVRGERVELLAVIHSARRWPADLE
jgi:toxin ParE1/3/4